MDNKNIDPWLYPGCVCEVWDDDYDVQEKRSAFRRFVKCSGIGALLFEDIKGGFYIPYSYYRPINTPWDYAPVDATHIHISSDGYCTFSDQCLGAGHFFINKIKLLWNDCPEHLKGKVLPRLEWAK